MGRNRKRDGKPFSDAVVTAVWQKATPILGVAPGIRRRDRCGAPIERTAYGNTDSRYGWEVDHILPVSKGGTDELANLQPLHWENNRGKGDDHPGWRCTRTS